jgi:hypothetical protein
MRTTPDNPQLRWKNQNSAWKGSCAGTVTPTPLREFQLRYFNAAGADPRTKSANVMKKKRI